MSVRLPLRPRQTNVELAPSRLKRKEVVKPAPYSKVNNVRDGALSLNGIVNSAPIVGSEHPSAKHDQENGTARRNNSRNKEVEEIEIEELRRKPNGDGHTVHRYLRGKLLGKGGFAKVYLCTSLDTNRQYAVKVVPKANLLKSRARQKLQAEIKIHRSLKNKYICEYKHFFEDKTNCYILLELCHNQSMNELLKRRKRLTEPEVKYFISQLLESIKYLHSINVIHRDLKIGNLFLDKNLKLKVGDFGLASQLASVDEKRKTICGTPNYIAPEIIDGNKEKRGHSFEVDIWSMGVICYTLLVGKPPYESKDVKSTYQRILTNKYHFPSHVPMSEDSRDLISRMLQTQPDKRLSLDKISMHPFFTHDMTKIPKSLPSCCTHIAPDWQEDAQGNLVPVVFESNLNNRHLKTANRMRKESVNEKEPLQIYDEGCSNYEKKADQFNSCTNMPKSKALLSVNHNTEKRKDENNVENLQKRQDIHDACLGDIITKVEACSLSEKGKNREGLTEQYNSELDDFRDDAPKIVSSYKDQDMLALESIHKRLTDTFSRPSPLADENYIKPRSPNSSMGAPKWVSRYVDYTSKYGLGFLLNDGSAGVYFNDSTKAVIESDGDSFIYVERKNNQQQSHMVEVYTLTSFPDILNKKVTLLKHFRKYLQEQQKREEGKNPKCSTGLQQKFENKPVKDTVFLKKWVRTKHAIFFRLSNKTVQVVFHDHTEVLLTSEGRIVTYIDKHHVRTMYHLEDIMVENLHADIKKRLKYSKDILHQLISGVKNETE